MLGVAYSPAEREAGEEGGSKVLDLLIGGCRYRLSTGLWGVCSGVLCARPFISSRNVPFDLVWYCRGFEDIWMAEETRGLCEYIVIIRSFLFS